MMILKSMIENAPRYQYPLYVQSKVNEQVEMMCYMKMPNAFKSTKVWVGFPGWQIGILSYFFEKKTEIFFSGGGFTLAKKGTLAYLGQS
jgi:hypothetical protein